MAPANAYPPGMARKDAARLNVSATGASVAVAVVLATAKLWAFSLTGSLSVAASLADSAADLLMSLAGLAAVVYAARPPDEDHAFGHTSAEDLAALGQSLFLFVSAGVIAATAAKRLAIGAPPQIEAAGVGMAVMVLSIVLSAGLVAWQTRVLSRTGSQVVAADRLHYLADLVPNLGALAALWAVAAHDVNWIDSAVALATAGLLVAGALRIFVRAWDGLMDRAAEPDLIDGIGALARSWPGIDGFHDLRTRRAGSQVFVNLHVEIDGEMTLEDAHAIAAALRREILRRWPHCDVMIHKDPTGVKPHPDDPTRAA